jgi:hypothetical protein
VIFSRRSGGGRHARREGKALELDVLAPTPEPEASHTSWYGPWDAEDAPPGERVDLGSLLIQPVLGVEIRVRASENGVIQQVELAHGANLLQLGAFAAPRSEGIWDEVRGEIRRSLYADGVEVEEVVGRWGIELRARVYGPNGMDDLRFIGIDGPRWMIRAVFQGPCAVDLAQAGPLWQCLTGVVVCRDDQARPAREPLPLHLPGSAAAEAGSIDEAADSQDQVRALEHARRKRRPWPRPRPD